MPQNTSRKAIATAVTLCLLWCEVRAGHFASPNVSTCSRETRALFKPADLEDSIRLLSALLVAAVAGWVLHRHGWPWYQWLPAVILVFAVVSVLWVLVWYLRRKLTYETVAQRTKASLRAGGDGWSDPATGKAP